MFDVCFTIVLSAKKRWYTWTKCWIMLVMKICIFSIHDCIYIRRFQLIIFVVSYQPILQFVNIPSMSNILFNFFAIAWNYLLVFDYGWSIIIVACCWNQPRDLLIYRADLNQTNCKLFWDVWLMKLCAILSRKFVTSYIFIYELK